MALNKNTLKAQLILIFSDPSTEGNIDIIADKIATAVDTYVKTATVATTVTGSSVSGGAVTAVGTGTLS